MSMHCVALRWVALRTICTADCYALYTAMQTGTLRTLLRVEVLALLTVMGLKYKSKGDYEGQ